MATLATYVPIVQAEVDDTSARAQTVIERGLKDTYQEIIRAVGKYLIGTTENTYTVTADVASKTVDEFLEINQVFYQGTGDDEKYRIYPISEEEYSTGYINADAGSPAKFFPRGTSLILAPAPENAGTLTVVGILAPGELSGGTVSVIPSAYENVLLNGAIAHFKMYESVPEAVEYNEKYLFTFNRMIQDLASKNAPVNPTFYGNVIYNPLRRL